MLFSTLLLNLEYTVLSGDPRTIDVCSVSSDSRVKSRDGLFVCICGARSDGHDYASMAYDNGFRAFVVTRPVGLPDDATIVLVKDSRRALALISAAFYGHPARELRIVGLTGTKGKTTTAITAYDILNRCGIPAAYIGSNGVKFGNVSEATLNTTPESLELQRYMRRMVDCGIKYLIMEVSSQAIYMDRICGIEFDTAVFTNLYEDHIGGAEHPTFEHYRDCKKRLFTDFGAKHLICNLDDPMAGFMMSDAKGCDILGCSALGREDADVRAYGIKKVRGREALSVSFKLVAEGRELCAAFPMPGAFSVSNALLAAAICLKAGLLPEEIAAALSEVTVEGRFETLASPSGALFVIDYAHNGAALSAALSAIREFSPERIICLFGSVGGRTKGRRRELGRVAAALADLCILTADNPDSERVDSIIDDIAVCFEGEGSCPFVRIPDREEAIRYAVSIAKAGDVVLLAGKGHEKYQLVDGKKLDFSERDIVMRAVAESVSDSKKQYI